MRDTVGCIITSLHWTFEYVDNIEWAQAEELMGYWCDHPPTHVLMLKAWFKPREDEWNPESQLPNTPQSAAQAEAAAELMARSLGAPTRDASTLPAELRSELSQVLAQARKSKEKR